MSQIVRCDNCNTPSTVKTSKVVPQTWWWALVGPYVACVCSPSCKQLVYRNGKRLKTCVVCQTITHDRIQMMDPDNRKPERIPVCCSCVSWREGPGDVQDLEHVQ